MIQALTFIPRLVFGIAFTLAAPIIIAIAAPINWVMR